jgi:hypothetical protein
LCVISLYEDCHLEVGFFRMVRHIIVWRLSSRGRVLSHGVSYHCMKTNLHTMIWQTMRQNPTSRWQSSYNDMTHHATKPYLYMTIFIQWYDTPCDKTLPLHDNLGIILLYEDCHLEVGFGRMVLHIIVWRLSSRCDTPCDKTLPLHDNLHTMIWHTMRPNLTSRWQSSYNDMKHHATKPYL